MKFIYVQLMILFQTVVSVSNRLSSFVYLLGKSLLLLLELIPRTLYLLIKGSANAVVSLVTGVLNASKATSGGSSARLRR